jgi:hypothetical protein
VVLRQYNLGSEQSEADHTSTYKGHAGKSSHLPLRSNMPPCLQYIPLIDFLFSGESIKGARGGRGGRPLPFFFRKKAYNEGGTPFNTMIQSGTPLEIAFNCACPLSKIPGSTFAIQ